MANVSHFKIDNPESKGPDKRHYQRRENYDRREMLRFEPENPNRRSGLDRRQENNIWNNLHRT